VTLGPLDPEIYEYSFRIGGERVVDPDRTNITNRSLSRRTMEPV
jgi:hypothetical protein